MNRGEKCSKFCWSRSAIKNKKEIQRRNLKSSVYVRRVTYDRRLIDLLVAIVRMYFKETNTKGDCETIRSCYEDFILVLGALLRKGSLLKAKIFIPRLD